jgi:argininosuccinate synthase
MNTRVVLAYSGGLKASVAIPWLVETYRAQVVAVVLDLGQGEDLADLRHRAIALGAWRCHVVDAREEFARDFVVPSVKADALLEGRYPTSTALGRAAIAKTLATIARIEDTKTVAHAGTGKDHLRLTGAARTLDSSLRVIACAEAWTFSDSELANVAERHQIAATGRGARVDRNLWGRTVGRWLDVDAAAPQESTSDLEAVLEIEFSSGVPIVLNGVTMQPAELIDSLATIGAEHGIGRLSRPMARTDGRVSQALYDAPAAVLLHTAHAELQRSVAPGAVQRFAPTIASAYADVIDRGEWFSNLRPALDAFVNEVQQHVTGLVRLTLYKGGVVAAGITQPAVVKP